MASISTWPGHRALHLPEIILQILSTLPPSSAAATAITCQAWKNLSLDTIWREIDLVNILDVLAPTERIDGTLVSLRTSPIPLGLTC